MIHPSKRSHCWVSSHALTEIKVNGSKKKSRAETEPEHNKLKYEQKLENPKLNSSLPLELQDGQYTCSFSCIISNS